MPEIVEATLEDLLTKPARQKKHSFHLPDPEDPTKARELTVVLRALGSHEYDALVERHPPTDKQKADGANFDSETFGPALLAESFVSPKLDVEAAKTLWHGENWTSGEIVGLFDACLNLNMRGLNVPFTDAG